MGRRQRDRACRQAASPCARDCRRTLQAPAIDNEIHAHCAHPETAAHHRRRRGLWAGARGDQRCRCREGEMSKSLTPGSGGVAADKTSRDVEGKLHSPTVAVSLIVNDQPRAITVEPRMTLLDTLREKLGLTGTKKAGAFFHVWRSWPCRMESASRRSKGWSETARSTRSSQRSLSTTHSNAVSAPPAKSCQA